MPQNIFINGMIESTKPPIINNDDDSLLKVECQHCRVAVDLSELDQHEKECLEKINDIIIQQERITLQECSSEDEGSEE